MRTIWILIIFVILYWSDGTHGEHTTPGYYDLNDDEQHLQVVQIIFSKLNHIINSTTEITAGLQSLNKRFDSLDQRVNKINQDFSHFKLDISKKVQDQAKIIANSSMNSTQISKQLHDLESRLGNTHKDLAAVKTEVQQKVEAQKNAIQKQVEVRFGEITQLLRKSSNDIESFKTQVAQKIDEHKDSLAQKVNMTLQYQQRQQNQIQLLWDHRTEWNVILRRQDGSVNFDRNWTEYKQGFGDPSGEFFVGLEVLHKMTSNGLQHELFISLEDFQQQQTFAKYDNFVLGSEAEMYKLKELGNHSGSADDSLTHHVGEKFTTFDRDNDAATGDNCAKAFQGPWWFYKCNPSSQLFGPYKPHSNGPRMRWGVGKLNDLKMVEVKIRQK